MAPSEEKLKVQNGPLKKMAGNYSEEIIATFQP
jgi:hypothetical protein